MEEKVIDLLKEGTLLSPPPGVCQECATDHPTHYPHNAESLFYQYAFRKQHDRWPTWTDALSHCSSEIKEYWTKELRRCGREV